MTQARKFTLAMSVLISACLPTSSAFADEKSAGPFSIVEQPIRIAPASQDGTTEITLRSSDPQTTPPGLADVELPHPPAAIVKFELISQPSQPQTTWRFKVIVSGLLPAAVTQQRYAVVSYGKGQKQTIPYSLTNTQNAFAWNIGKMADPWVAAEWWTGPSCIGFTVTPKDGPATNVNLAASALVEQSTKHALSIDKLLICEDGKKECGENGPLNLPANTPTRLMLCTTESVHGNFHGALTLTSVQKPDGEALLQNASFSSGVAKLAGFLVLCVGVVLAWWTKVWARARLERDQSLLPAVLLKSYVVALQRMLSELPTEYKNAASSTAKLLDAIGNDLSDSALDGHQFLPPSFPSPYGYTVDTAGYKAYIEARSNQIQLLSLIVKEGVSVAAGKDNDRLTAPRRTLIADAIRSMDALGTKVPPLTPDQLRQSLQTILAGLQNALYPAPGAGAMAPQLGAPLPTETQTLQIDIQRIGKGIWLVYGALTTLSGLAVLILNNPGFGVPLDFIFAFFWGFGLPTTVGSLTPSSASSALNISISKA
jgi:hypothetical protein